MKPKLLNSCGKSADKKCVRTLAPLRFIFLSGLFLLGVHSWGASTDDDAELEIPKSFEKFFRAQATDLATPDEISTQTLAIISAQSEEFQLMMFHRLQEMSIDPNERGVMHTLAARVASELKEISLPLSPQKYLATPDTARRFIDASAADTGDLAIRQELVSRVMALQHPENERDIIEGLTKALSSKEYTLDSREFFGHVCMQSKQPEALRAFAKVMGDSEYRNLFGEAQSRLKLFPRNKIKKMPEDLLNQFIGNFKHFDNLQDLSQGTMILETSRFLADSSDPRVTQALQAALQRTDKALHGGAYVTLSLQHNPKNLEMLVTALESGELSPAYTELLIDGIGQTLAQDPSNSRTLLQKFLKAAVSTDPVASPRSARVLQAAAETNPEAYKSVMAEMEEFFKGRIKPSFVKKDRSMSPPVIQEIGRAYDEIGPYRDFPLVDFAALNDVAAAGLKSSDPEVRKMAIQKFSKYGAHIITQYGSDVKAFNTLVATYAVEKDPAIRKEIGNAIIKVLGRSDAVETIKGMQYEGLPAVVEEERQRHILAAVAKSEKAVQEDARRLIVELKLKRANYLRSQIGPRVFEQKVRTAVTHALRDAPNEAERRKITTTLFEEENPFTRATVEQTFREPEFREILNGMTQSADPAEQAAAYKIIQRVRVPEDLDYFVGKLQSASLSERRGAAGVVDKFLCDEPSIVTPKHYSGILKVLSDNDSETFSQLEEGLRHLKVPDLRDAGALTNEVIPAMIETMKNHPSEIRRSKLPMMIVDVIKQNKEYLPKVPEEVLLALVKSAEKMDEALWVLEDLVTTEAIAAGKISTRVMLEILKLSENPNKLGMSELENIRGRFSKASASQRGNLLEEIGKTFNQVKNGSGSRVMSDPKAKVIIEGLKDKSPYVRIKAAEAISTLLEVPGAAEAIHGEPLEKILALAAKDPDKGVQFEMRRAQGILKARNPGAYERIVRLIGKAGDTGFCGSALEKMGNYPQEPSGQ